MKTWRARLLVSAVCLVLGLMLVPQFRSQRTDNVFSQSLNDQASYISSLYRNNLDLRDQLAELQHEVDTYRQNNDKGSSTLETLVKDIQQLRIANGEVDISGPGVRVIITSTVDARHLQDAVNELRNAGVEGMALNGVRLLTRSVIAADGAGHIVVDKQQIAPPYAITAIGNPDTLNAAAERKGGLFDLWQAGEKLTIQVTKIDVADHAGRLVMPKTALDQQWRFAKPVAQTP